MSQQWNTTQAYFKKLYDFEADPFHNWDNSYEVTKRQKALSLLSRPYYDSIFEPACGNGSFTKDLAEITRYILASDWSYSALTQAMKHCQGQSQIEFLLADFPSDLPPHRFDLIVLSEVLYYFSVEQQKEVYHALRKIAKEDAEILLVHWRGKSQDYPSHGDEVHLLARSSGLFRTIREEQSPKYNILLGQIL